MRKLDRARLLDAPDHAVLKRPWDGDIREIQCSWDGGNHDLRLEVLLAKPGGLGAVRLVFRGVFDLYLEGFRPLVGLRILDTTVFLPEIPAPICGIHYDWVRGKAEPYFWATSVELARIG